MSRSLSPFLLSKISALVWSIYVCNHVTWHNTNVAIITMLTLTSLASGLLAVMTQHQCCHHHHAHAHITCFWFARGDDTTPMLPSSSCSRSHHLLLVCSRWWHNTNTNVAIITMFTLTSLASGLLICIYFSQRQRYIHMGHTNLCLEY